MTKTARALTVVVMALLTLVIAAPTARAQDVDAILGDLEAQGWYIEPGGEGRAADFDALVQRARSSANNWYFVSLAGPVEGDFADVLRDEVRPTGNVIVYFVDQGDFVSVQLATGASESVEDQALAPFDGDWATPDEFMADVVTTFDRLTSTTTTGSTGAPARSGDDSGGGLGWLWIAVPAVLIVGGIWFSGRSRKKKQKAEALDAAQKLRDQIQTELDELANDVLVLSGPVDLCEKPEAVQHYREAAATYTAISDEIPDLDQLEHADLGQLADLGARVAHARWQMDAAEAIIDGEPVPEPPKVEPPPPPPQAEAPAPPARLPDRRPRPRVPYSPSRRRGGGGGLLDILIGGAVLSGSQRRGGGMFGGSPRRTGSGGMLGGSSRRTSAGGPRPGGGVFGSGSRRSGSSRRSTSRSRSRSSGRSRSRSRSSSTRRSTSRSRRR